jgi:hypothetical protein
MTFPGHSSNLRNDLLFPPRGKHFSAEPPRRTGPWETKPLQQAALSTTIYQISSCPTCQMIRD